MCYIFYDDSCTSFENWSLEEHKNIAQRREKDDLSTRPWCLWDAKNRGKLEVALFPMRRQLKLLLLYCVLIFGSWTLNLQTKIMGDATKNDVNDIFWYSRKKASRSFDNFSSFLGFTFLGQIYWSKASCVHKYIIFVMFNHGVHDTFILLIIGLAQLTVVA